MTVRIRVPPPLVAPAPGFTGADRAGWFSHLLWAPLTDRHARRGLCDVVARDRESGVLVVRPRDLGTVPVEAFERSLPDHVLAWDGPLLTVSCEPGLPLGWVESATVSLSDRPDASGETGPYRIDQLTADVAVFSLDRRGGADADLADRIEVYAIADPQESLDLLRTGYLDAALELDAPADATATGLCCWATLGDGVAVQGLTWHRERCATVIDAGRRLSTLDVGAWSRSLYGDCVLPAAGLVPSRAASAVDAGGDPSRWLDLHLLVNVENPTRTRFVEQLRDAARAVRVNIEARQVAWFDLADPGNRAETDATLMTRWFSGGALTPAPDVAFTAHPERSLVGRDIDLARLMLPSPVPVAQWAATVRTRAARRPIL